MERQREISGNTGTGGRSLCNRANVCRLAEETYECEWGSVRLELTSSQEDIFPKTSIQDQKVHLFSLKQSKHCHSRGFWCLQNWRARKVTPMGCQDLWRWGTGWQKGSPRHFMETEIFLWNLRISANLHYLTEHAHWKFLPAQNKKGILVFWLLNRANDLHTKILLRDGYGKTGKS